MPHKLCITVLQSTIALNHQSVVQVVVKIIVIIILCVLETIKIHLIILNQYVRYYGFIKFMFTLGC